MARFDVTPDPTVTPSYVGLSEGPRSSPNTALGNLFEGLATAVDQGVKEQDRNIQENIKQDIFDQVDKVQNEFGVGDATDFQADAEKTNPKLPLQLERAGQSLDNLKKAYISGDLKDSHYWARLNSMTRQLRAKYPGYRDEIDTMVSGVTGAKPANALRAALFDEWQADKTAAGKGNELELWAAKEGRLPVDYFDRQAGANPYSQTELEAYIAGKTRQDAEVASRRSSLALASDQQTLQTKDVTKSFAVESNQLVTSILQDGSGAAGKDFSDLQKKLQAAQQAVANGKPLDQKEVDTMRGQLGSLKVQVLNALQQKFTQSWDGNPQHSYMANMSKKDRDDIIENAMTPINTIEQAMDAKNPYGVLGAVSAYLDAQKNDSSREAIESTPFFQKLQGLSNVLGPQVVSQVLALSPKTRASLDQTLLNYTQLDSIDPSSKSTVADDYSMGQAKGATPEFYQGVLKSWVDQISSPDLPLAVKQAKVQHMFGPGSDAVMAQLNDASKYEYFKSAASPQVSKAMLQLKSAGDMDSWNTYQRWVANSFQILFSQKVQDLQDSVTRPETYDVKWDAVSNRFDMSAKILGTIPQPSWSTYGDANMASVQQLNDTLQVIAPIINDAKGDTGKEVLTLLTQMGYNPDAPAQSGFIRELASAIRKKLTAQQESEAAAKAK